MWNEVVLDYEDETMAFGPRKVLGAPGKYDVKTLATVSTVHTVKPSPDITCLVSSDYTVLVADVQLCVFSSECSEFLFALTFDGLFEAAALGPGGVLVLGESGTGKLHLVSLPMQQLLVSMPLLNSEKEAFSKIWISPTNVAGQSHLVVLTTCQEVHVFSPLDPAAIYKALQSGSQELLQEFQKSLRHSTFSPTEITQGELSRLLKDGHPPLVRWLHQLEGELVLPALFPGRVRRVVHSLSQRYTLVLDEEDCLHVMCPTTFLPLHSWQGLRDFTLSSPSPDSEKLVVLVNGTMEEAELQVWNFPQMEQQFRVVLSPWCHLASVESGVETILVLEGSAEQSKIVNRLLLREVKEIVPENRLNLLLRKHKFEEAEILAKLHRLSTEEIHKSRLSLQLKKIANSPEDESLLHELKSCLSHISDSTFVFNSCMQLNWPSEKVCCKILLLVQQHLQDCGAAVELLSEVGRTLYRLDTFSLMPRNLYDWSYWAEFAHSTCLQLFHNLLHYSHTEAAFLLWERHSAELFSTLSQPEKVREILAVVPDGLSVDLLVFWLRKSLLPGLLQRCPLAYEDVAAWLKERVFALEATDRKHWPDNGIKLTAAVTDQPSTEDTTHLARLNYHLVQQLMGEPHSALYQLTELHKTLRQLHVLWGKLRCRIPLSTFLQADKKEVVYDLLRSVPDYLTGELVKSFLDSYMGRQGLEQGPVLLSYVQQLVQSNPQSWRMRDEPVWLPKVLRLLESIHNLDLRLAAVVSVASQSPVPWSPAVSSLVDFTLKQLHHHPQHCQLEHEKKVLGLKQVLLKYDIRTCRMDDKSRAHQLLVLILHQDHSSLEEGLEVCKVFPHVAPYDVYFLRSRQLLTAGKLDDFRNLLDAMPADLLPYLGKDLSRYVCSNLHDSSLTLLEGAVCSGRLMDSKSSTHLFLERVLALWKEFGFRPSLEQLQDREWCLRELKKKVESSLKLGVLDIPQQQHLDDRKPSLAHNLFFKLVRLGQLLGLGLEVRSIMANCAAQLVKHKEALTFFREIARETSPDMSRIVEALRFFCLQVDPTVTEPEMVLALTELAQSALTNVPPKLLVDLVPLYIWLSDLHSLLKHVASDYSNDDYTVWKLSPIYTDKGFCLPQSPLIQAYRMAFPLSPKSGESSPEKPNEVPSLVHFLICRAHDLKAFRMAVRLCFLKKAPFIKDLVGTILLHLTNKSSPDYSLGLGLVASIPSHLSSTFSSLRQMVGRESRNTQHLAAIGIAYAAHCHMPQVVLQLHVLYLQAYWSNRLEELKVPQLPKANPTEASSRLLVRRVVGALDLTLMLELAESLGLDLKDLVPEFLKAAVQSPPGKLKPLKAALDLGPQPTVVLDLLNHMVSPYNYEAIGALLDHLTSRKLNDSKLLSKGPALVKLLTGYARCAPPADYEKELWEELPLPLTEELSATRLPFHAFFRGRAYKIYKQELFPETLKAWLPIASLLELDRDDLLMVTVNNTLNRWLAAHGDKQQIEDSSLLASLADIFQSISNPEKATVCATDVLQRLPPSASFMRCMVAEGSIKLATWWNKTQESSSRDPAMALQELTQQHNQLATIHLLQKHGLQDLYKSGSMTPQELVLALLQHPEIDGQLVEQVVAIHSLDLAELCTDAVEEWLDDVVPPEYNANETFNLTAFKMTSPIDLDLEHQNQDWDLNKMVQLLRHSNLQQALCLRLVNSSLNLSCSTYKKTQILRALFSVRSDVGLLSGREDLWERLQALTCLSDLEALHLPISLEAVMTCSSKQPIVTMLISSRGYDCVALHLALSLCLDQGIWCPELWSQLLERLIQSEMLPRLEKVLPILNHHPPVWQSPQAVRAWTTLITQSFKRHDTLTPRNLVKIFGDLLRCPCRDQLDIEDLAKRFESAGSTVLGWGCRMLSPNGTTSSPVHLSELSQLLESDPAASIFLSPILQQLPSQELQ